ncbi:MAG: PHP domain-containing protein [Clostridia bacterium]|nr:PHP domain-containing protein [Clostridia bacterium]
MTYEELMIRLNHPMLEIRLAALKELVAKEKAGELDPVESQGDVNNHIHTWYSFSPYSPTKAAWMAHRAGLATAGIMDHDSIAGAEEFLTAGEILDLDVTSGLELRVSFANTPFADKRINNPDQSGIAYVALHAVPECGRVAIEEYLKGVSLARARRNRKMVAKINELVAPLENKIKMEYACDVLLYMTKKGAGGSVTERHLLFALAGMLIDKFGKGEKLIDALENQLGLKISAKNREWLSDTENPGYAYDVLGVLKGELVSKIYVDADTDECPDVREVIELAKKSGAICAYAYLGDVGSSVTGDKRPQSFEDAYLDELIPYLKELGFNAVTYMPSRNTPEQLARLKALCEANDLFQISGEDINSPRQNFVCMAARAPEFANLKTAAYALIGSEKAAKNDIAESMFSAKSVAAEPSLAARTEAFAARA